MRKTVRVGECAKVLWHIVKRQFLSLGLPLLHSVSGSSWYAAIPLPNKQYSFDLQTQKLNGQWHWVINNRLNLHTQTSELSTEWRSGFVKLLKFIEGFVNIRFECHHMYIAVVLLDISPTINPKKPTLEMRLSSPRYPRPCVTLAFWRKPNHDLVLLPFSSVISVSLQHWATIQQEEKQSWKKDIPHNQNRKTETSASEKWSSRESVIIWKSWRQTPHTSCSVYWSHM